MVRHLAPAQQRRLLQFWTGLSHLPAGGFKHLGQQLQLVPARGQHGEMEEGEGAEGARPAQVGQQAAEAGRVQEATAATEAEGVSAEAGSSGAALDQIGSGIAPPDGVGAHGLEGGAEAGVAGEMEGRDVVAAEAAASAADGGDDAAADIGSMGRQSDSDSSGSSVGITSSRDSGGQLGVGQTEETGAPIEAGTLGKEEELVEVVTVVVASSSLAAEEEKTSGTAVDDTSAAANGAGMGEGEMEGSDGGSGVSGGQLSSTRHEADVARSISSMRSSSSGDEAEEGGEGLVEQPGTRTNRYPHQH